MTDRNDHFRIGLSEGARREMLAASEAGKRGGEMASHAQRSPVDLSDPAALKAHLLTAHDWEDSDFWRNSHDDPDPHPVLGRRPDDDYEMTHNQLRAVHDRFDHVQFASDFPGSITLGDDHFHEA